MQGRLQRGTGTQWGHLRTSLRVHGWKYQPYIESIVCIFSMNICNILQQWVALKMNKQMYLTVLYLSCLSEALRSVIYYLSWGEGGKLAGGRQSAMDELAWLSLQRKRRGTSITTFHLPPPTSLPHIPPPLPHLRTAAATGDQLAGDDCYAVHSGRQEKKARGSGILRLISISMLRHS